MCVEIMYIEHRTHSERTYVEHIPHIHMWNTYVKQMCFEKIFTYVCGTNLLHIHMWDKYLTYAKRVYLFILVEHILFTNMCGTHTLYIYMWNTHVKQMCFNTFFTKVCGTHIRHIHMWNKYLKYVKHV